MSDRGFPISEFGANLGLKSGKRPMKNGNTQSKTEPGSNEVVKLAAHEMKFVAFGLSIRGYG